MATKIAAKGVIVKSGSSATPTQALPGVKSVAVTIGGRDLINTTSHDSGTTKDYVASPLRDTNSIELELFFDPSNTYHDELADAHNAGTKWYLTLVLPDAGAAQWALSGYITAMSVPTLDPETGALMCTLSYKADSADTYTQ